MTPLLDHGLPHGRRGPRTERGRPRPGLQMPASSPVVGRPSAGGVFTPVRHHHTPPAVVGRPSAGGVFTRCRPSPVPPPDRSVVRIPTRGFPCDLGGVARKRRFDGPSGHGRAARNGSLGRKRSAFTLRAMCCSFKLAKPPAEPPLELVRGSAGRFALPGPAVPLGAGRVQSGTQEIRCQPRDGWGWPVQDGSGKCIRVRMAVKCTRKRRRRESIPSVTRRGRLRPAPACPSLEQE